MQEMTPEKKNQIIEALRNKGATRACPRCGHTSFELVGGYFNHFIQHDFSNINFGGQSIPTAVVICSNCGALSEHALGALGLLPEPIKKAPEGESK